jgi:hypothetical protein
MHQTTQGWKFLVEWSNGLRQWIDLKLLKESNPVHVAEYATSRNIAKEPAFAWLVPYVLRKRDAIVKAVNSCVCRTSHKYGIELPTSVKHTIDQDALKKEMGSICIAFEILGPNKKATPGWHKALGHINFDVNMDFTRNSPMGIGWSQDSRLPNFQLCRGCFLRQHSHFSDLCCFARSSSSRC